MNRWSQSNFCRWDKEGGGSNNTKEEETTENEEADAEAEATSEEEPGFEEWLEKEHPEIFGKYSTHTANLVSALRKEREANKGAKTKLKRLVELETADTERKKSEMDEITRLQTELEEQKAKSDSQATALQELKINHAVLSAAAQYEFEDPKDALRFVDRKEIGVDEDGEVTGAEEAVKALVKKRGYLLKQKLKEGNDGGSDDDSLDKDPKKKKKIKDAQPKIPI